MKAVVCISLVVIAVVGARPGFSQTVTAPAPGPTSPPPAVVSNVSPSAITIQLVQPAPEKQSAIPKAIETSAPYFAALIALLAVWGALYQARMEARFTYASEILKFRLRQVNEFYAPALLYVEQSRTVYEKLLWTIESECLGVPLPGFRLLDHMYRFKTNPQYEVLKPLVLRILSIGNQLTELISKNSGLIEGGLTATFIDYQAHFEILNAASEQELTASQKEGWHEFGYYPRMLNREIREGYKVALAHLENYATAGDTVISRLLKQRGVDIGKYRHQLIANLQFYEKNVKRYAEKFDKFDLSAVRDRFVEEVERTRTLRPASIANDMLNILDAGCGTGRDAVAFLRKGYAVAAVDASPAMLRECRRKLRDAKAQPDSPEMRRAAEESRWLESTFDELTFRNEFDGVWAAASVLHVPSQQMEDTMCRLVKALKPNGILFTSFKYGRGEHEYDARFYTYYSKADIRSLLRRVPCAETIEVWLSDAGGKRLSWPRQKWAWLCAFCRRYDRTLWLNVLVRRKAI